MTQKPTEETQFPPVTGSGVDTAGLSEIEREESLIAFGSQVEILSATIPELQSRPEVVDAGNELIGRFDLSSSLFDSADRTVVFLGIASHWAEAQASVDAEGMQRRLFVENALTVLARKHSTQFVGADKVIEESNRHEGLSDEEELAVYDKYTDVELTALVEERIRDGALAAVKERLQVTEDNESPYRLRVMTFAPDNQLYGIDAPKVDYTLPWDSPELEAQKQLVEEMKNWKAQMVATAAEFTADMKLHHDPAMAWVTTTGGERTICISTALAMKIVNPGVIDNTDWYDADHLSRDIATLEHEYTHSQGGLSVDEEVAFGINLEEYRAEFFSGSKQGYQDIKGLLGDYHLATGHSLTEEFLRRPKGGTAAEVQGAIANQIGLSLMLELIMSAPQTYRKTASNEYMDGAYAFIGGYDDVLGRIVDQQIAAGNEAGIDERIGARAKKVIEVYSKADGIQYNSWVSYRTNLGLDLLTKRVVDKIEALL